MSVSPIADSGKRALRHWSVSSTSQVEWTTGIPSTPTGSRKTVRSYSWTIGTLADRVARHPTRCRAWDVTSSRSFVRALGVEQADIFGFSIGGTVAQQIALDAPELVRRLILAGTGPSSGDGMAAFSPQVQEIMNRPNMTPAERGLALFFSPSAASQAAGRAWIARMLARQVDREPPASARAAGAQLTALAKWGQVVCERYASLKSIPHRTLVVNGHDDIMVPTVNSYILQQKLPDARLILFPDSGHGAHFQFAAEFAEAAGRFLAAD